MVIGANFGDEGKGLFTDYFTHEEGPTVVVRFNGGAQAGHTVVTPNGKRHIFKHFACGTLQGVPTHLSSMFIVNPILFKDEYQKLQELGVEPKVTMDPNAKVTLPVDMIVNQMLESLRSDRHGSCGVGIHQTVLRSGYNSGRIQVKDLKTEKVRKVLEGVMTSAYLQQQITAARIYGVTPPDNYVAAVKNPKATEDFMESVAFLRSHSGVTTDKSVAQTNFVLFEGAQGLLLDQGKHYYWPHVTPSSTGLTNVVPFARSGGIEHLDITYVTRCYVTRHGPGILHHEKAELKYEDTTNVDNTHQGPLRFAALDIDNVANAIEADLQHINGMSHEASVGVTHADQSDKFWVQLDSTTSNWSGEEICSRMQSFLKEPRELGTVRMLLSNGPTRNDITEL